MNEKMKKALQETLQPDESILWESGTEPFRIFDGREGRVTLAGWAVVAAIDLFMGVSYATHGGKGAGLYIVLILAFAIVIGSSLISYRQTKGQRCFITDRSAFAVRPDGSVFKMKRSDVDAAQIYALDHGGDAIALGSELMAEKDRQLRWRANHPLERSDYTLHGMVFYHVENASEAMRLLRGGEEA